MVDPDGHSPSTGDYRVRVLGPLTVAANGRVFDLGGRQQRLVLALLVSRIGDVVSTEALIDGLWGEDPPSTARKAVQVHVANLRREFGEGFPLRTAPGGYVLQSASLDVDAARFEVAFDAARAQLRTDSVGAERMLTDALALWNGPAYADLDGEHALEPEMARLDELRIVALETRAEAGLRAGSHAELVGELTALCAEHPYRERLTELLMLALYRSSRQTEALRAYERTRSVLVDELGVEPGPTLRELHHQILEQSGELELDEESIEHRFAFLATDIESSAAMWEADTEAMQQAVARHDEILAHAVVANAGTVFKGTGDGIYAVFAGAADALQAAVDAQQALFAESWATERPLRVRMGVDEGPASARGGDYFGPVMNRVSRIMSSGHGGQLLCPTDLAAQAPTPTRHLGGADYKGVGRLDVAQVEIPGLPDEFPALQTERAPKTVMREGFGRAIRGYELREQLGEGAHGVVYRAYQATIGREVAIKVIRPEHANQPEFVKRFEAEAQFVAQLEHPHIVSLYDYWRDPDGAYLVMQLLRGGSLATALERAPWRPPAAMQALDQVGTALDYAHRHGVMHHDLKPANVLLDGEGNAYLSDFSIAARHIEAVGVPVDSTVAYLSPEELAGETAGPAADMYGLALLTYEILTGDRPPLGGQPTPVAELRPDLPPTLDEVLARAADPDPAKRFGRVDDFLRALRRGFGTDVVTRDREPAPAEIRNPYKGLRAFAETDADDFAGRDELVEELLDHVTSHRLTALVGPSGSGKSSLVRAGLLPRIRRRSVGGSGTVLVTDMFPGSYPFEELEAALLRVGVAHQDGLLGELVADDRGLLRMSKQLLPDDDSELLLVIDQFEELFLLTHDDEARHRFLANLVTVARDERSRVRLVVTIRADHFDRPLAEPEFGSLLRNSVVPVAMPTQEELTRAVAQPAAAAGLEFEPGLVPRIVGDVADQPGALPLLQYAMTELVGTRQGVELTMVGYDRIGGVEGALSQRAEEIFEGLGDAARDATREVFLRLVAVDESGDDTRRRARRSELESLGLAEEALDSTLSHFGSFRLLSFDRDPITRGPTLEVAHEALIREWPRLAGWIDERREALLLERRLEAACAEWEAAGREPSFLFAGGKLDHYEEWARATDLRLTQRERDFLDDARRVDDEDRARRRRRRRGVIAALGLLAVLACGAAVAAMAQRNEANRSADRADEAAERAAGQAALARDAATAAEETAYIADTARMAANARHLADQDQGVALLLAAEAHRRDPSVDTLSALQTALAARRGFLGFLPVEGEAQRVDFAHDGSIVVGTTDQGLQIFDPNDHTLTRTIDYKGLGYLAASRQEPLVATTDGVEVVVFDLVTGEPVTRFVPASVAGLESVWFAPNGDVLVALEGGGLAIHAPNGEAIGELPSDGVVEALTFSHDDRLLVVADGAQDGFDIWEYASRRALAPAEMFSTADQQEAAGGTAGGGVAGGVRDDAPGPQAVAFSSDDAHLAASYPSGLVVIWEVTEDGSWPIHRFPTFNDGARAVLVDPAVGGYAVHIVDTEPLRVISTGSGRLTTWNLGETAVIEPRDPTRPVRSTNVWPSFDLAYDERTATIVTIGDDVEVWSTDDRELLAAALGAPATNLISASSDGRFILTQDSPAGVAPFEITRRDLITGETVSITGDGGYGPSLSPDDTVIVTGHFADCAAGSCSTLQLWDASTLEPIGAPLEVPPGLQLRAFSPDGRHLAVGYGAGIGRPEDTSPLPTNPATDAYIDLFEVSATGLRRTARITEFKDMLTDGRFLFYLTFSSDGRTLLTMDDSGEPAAVVVAEWRVPDGALVRGPDEIHAVVEGGVRGPTTDGTRYAWRPDQASLLLVDQDTLEPEGPPFLGAVSGNYNRARFTDDDRLMVTSGPGGVVLWDVADRSAIGPFPAGFALRHELLPETSPLGPGLLTTTLDQLRAWNLDVDSWPDIACAAAGRNLTVDEWDRFGPEEPYHATCDRWPTSAGT